MNPNGMVVAIGLSIYSSDVDQLSIFKVPKIPLNFGQ